MALPGVLEEQVFKMHTAKDGLVWYVDGGHGAINTHAPIEDFLADAICQRARHVRMVGSAGNARALCAMYNRKLRGELLRLEVASPAVVGRTRAERDDPRLMLVRIRDSAVDGLNPAMGGWHEFGAMDYPSYALAACNDCDAEFRGCGRVPAGYAPQPSSVASTVIHQLPGYAQTGEADGDHTRSSLVSFRCEHRCRGNDIIPYHDDAAKLHAYLGLDPRTMAGVLGLCDETGAADRCRLVLKAWSNEVPSAAELWDPDYFLWRRYHREGGPIKGALRASQMFVNYLRLVWLDALYCDRAKGQPAAPGKRPLREGLFAPDHFFSQRSEATAYSKHRDAIEGEG